jgi:DNA-binding CsgD family transcriptional regulator
MEERPWKLDEAIGVLHRVGAEFELATALADLSSAQLALGEPGRARLAAERAIKLARKCHARTLVARLHPVVATRRTVELLDGGAELSDAEERVAALVCRGLTNREIAAKLFITLSTVEQHLTRVYRKLGVDSRSDVSLALRMRALDGRPGLGESDLAAEPPILRITLPVVPTPVRSGRG